MSCESSLRESQPFLAAGSLDEAERRAAEAHAASCPECAQELKEARAVMDGLRALHLTADEVVEAAWGGPLPGHLQDCPRCQAEVEAVRQANTELGPAAVLAAPERFGQRASRLLARFAPPALAAALLLSAGLGLRLGDLSRENRRLGRAADDAARARRERDQAAGQAAELQAALDRASAPQVNAPVVNLEPAGGQRGAGPDALPTVPRAAVSVTLVLHLAEDHAGRGYAAEIRDAQGRLVCQATGLVKSPIDTFTLAVPLRLLPPGAYRVRLTADGRAVPVETYAFQVR